MSTIDLTPVEAETAGDADADLVRRLERLAAMGRSTSDGPKPTAPKPPSSRAPAGARRRRRHAAKRSRLGALALSLAATGGLAVGFSATDSPTSSVVTASGGIVSADAAAGPTVVNGDAFTNKWGPVQVQATFGADGSLVSVDTLQAPFADGKSVRINDRAVPVLESEALTAQSASVDTVSGATYTSRGYEQSLQSAIDEARAAGVTELV